MLKKLISTAILSSVIGSVSANPELGYMTQSTDQNHFFNATIALDALPAELTDKKLKVKLGSITDFYRHNIEYDKQVASLRFKVARDSHGKPIIRVRSNREITTEQLRAVVKLTVGKQKIYGIYNFKITPNKERHVTLNLLNTDHKPIGKQLFTEKIKSSTQKALSFIASTATIYEEGVKDINIPSYEQYQVKAGQSISRIAMELLPRYPKVSNWQTLMNKLAALNPGAFINGDINQLRADAKLQLPGYSQKRAPLMAQNQKEKVPANTSDSHSINSTILINSLPAELAGNKNLEVKLGSIADFYRQRIDYSQQVASLRFDLTTNSNEETEIRAYSVREISAKQLTAVVKLSVGRKKVYGIYELRSDKTGRHITFNLLGTNNRNNPQVVKQLSVPTEESAYKDSSSSQASVDIGKKQALESLRNKLKSYEQTQSRSTKGSQSEMTVSKDNSSLVASSDIDKVKALEALRNKLKKYEQAQNRNTRSSQPKTNIRRVNSSSRGENIYRISQGDTLSTIAMNLTGAYPEATSWRAVMKLLVTLNPDVFINGDINKIRTGTRLTLPESSHFEQLYNVATSESISSIAWKLQYKYPQPGGWKGMMSQLIHMNPETFINGNPHKLRDNVFLIIPSTGQSEIEAEIQELPESQPWNGTYNKIKLLQSDQEENAALNHLPRKMQSSLHELSVQEKAEKVYRVTEGESLAAIALKLMPDYPQLDSWYDLMEELTKLNPSLLADNDIGAINDGTLLQLPEKTTHENQFNHTARQSLPVEQKNTRQPDNPAGNVTMISYDKISKSLISRVSKKSSYAVPDGYTISMVAIKLFPRFPGYESWPVLMDKLYKLNPEAFVDSDINKLRTNSRLKLPGTT